MRSTTSAVAAMILAFFTCLPQMADAQGILARIFGGGTDTAGLRATIWVDPDGCEHWVIDDGIEGYMSQHLDQKGKPVCRAVAPPDGICKTFDSAATFDTGSAILRSAARAQMQTYFETIPGSTVVVAGHTDSIGAAAFNQSLSERRAEAVAELARSLGVVATTRGFGEGEPVASNDTAAGRAKNRRVDLYCL